MKTSERSVGDPTKSVGTVETVDDSVVSTKPDSRHKPRKQAGKSWLSRNGKFVIGGVGLFLVVLVASALFVYFFLINDTEDLPEGYRLASEYLNASINQSADPCVDFAQFACGQWVAKHPIPDNKTETNLFDLLEDLEAEHLRELFSVEEKHNSSAVNKLRKAYKTCVRDDPEEGLNFARSAILHGTEWYYPMATPKNPYDLIALEAILFKLVSKNVFPFHRFSVIVDPKNASQHVLKIDQPETLLPPEYYRDRKKYAAEITATKEYVHKKLNLLGFKDPDKLGVNYTFDKEAQDIVEFDANLSSILALKSERQDPFKLYHRMTFGEFSKMTQFDYAWILLPVHPQARENLFRNELLPIVSTGVDYLEKVNKLINETNNQVLVTYMLYRYFETFDTFFMGEQFDSVTAEYRQKVYGEQKSEEPRWRRCVRIISQHYTYAASFLWAERYFYQSAGAVAGGMISDLKAGFKEILDKQKWMTAETKKRAHKKIDEMVINAGYQAFAGNIRQLDHYYRSIDSAYPFVNFLEHSADFAWFKIDNEFLKLLEKPDRHENTVTASTINIYNYPEHNSITIPAGILQVPFFHPTFPRSMNYGAIGSLIGREIAQGFDDNGRNYDYEGKLENWWDKETADGFDASSKCIAKEYGAIEIPEMNLKLNGENTAREIMENNGGIKASYAAYMKFVAKKGPEPAVPGLKYSHEQLFFLAYAQNWCETIKPDALRDLVSTGKHSPGKYRTNVVLQKMPDFALAFNCPSGSAMNPTSEKRCELW